MNAQNINKQSKGRRLKPIFFTASVLILIVLSFAVTFGAGVGAPSWQQVFSALGIEDIAKTQGRLTVHFIDVGQGDSILISAENSNILIDSGPESLNQTTLTYLERRGVERLDLVVVTHPDKDHIGDMWNVLNSIDVQQVWMPQVEPENEPDTMRYQNLLEVIEEKQIPLLYASRGDEYKSEGLTLQVISPSNENYDNTNDSSVCILLTYGENKFLFMGDAQERAEENIVSENTAGNLTEGLDIRSDVLKVGHHGSSSSTTQAFAEMVKPKYAVVSVGKNNYNLPKKSVLKRLENLGTSIYRTDKQGTVVFVSDGKEVNIITEKGTAA